MAQTVLTLCCRLSIGACKSGRVHSQKRRCGKGGARNTYRNIRYCGSWKHYPHLRSLQYDENRLWGFHLNVLWCRKTQTYNAGEHVSLSAGTSARYATPASLVQRFKYWMSKPHVGAGVATGLMRRHGHGSSFLNPTSTQPASARESLARSQA